jgi:hypothetical protein
MAQSVPSESVAVHLAKGEAFQIICLGNRRWMWSPILATFDDPRRRAITEILIFAGEDGSPYASEVTARARDRKERLQPEDLRLPLQAVIRAAVALSAFRGPDQERGASLANGEVEIGPGDPALSKRPRRRTQRTDEYMTRVAEIYRRAFTGGLSVQGTVAAELQISAQTAANTIGEARRRGFLPPTEKRKARA